MNFCEEILPSGRLKIYTPPESEEIAYFFPFGAVWLFDVTDTVGTFFLVFGITVVDGALTVGVMSAGWLIVVVGVVAEILAWERALFTASCIAWDVPVAPVTVSIVVLVAPMSLCNVASPWARVYLPFPEAVKFTKDAWVIFPEAIVIDTE